MTTESFVDDMSELAISERRPGVLLENFTRKRVTLRDSVDATDGQTVDASKEAMARNTIKRELLVPEGADYVTPAARGPSRQPYFRVYQAWEGTVHEVLLDSFNARMRDLTDSDRPDEIVEMFVEDVDENDIPLLRPGAVFYWNIGYLEGRGFPRQRTSRVTFRRIPRLLASATSALSVEEIRDALAE